jgi:hypothetical protein
MCFTIAKWGAHVATRRVMWFVKWRLKRATRRESGIKARRQNWTGERTHRARVAFSSLAAWLPQNADTGDETPAPRCSEAAWSDGATGGTPGGGVAESGGEDGNRVRVGMTFEDAAVSEPEPVADIERDVFAGDGRGAYRFDVHRVVGGGGAGDGKCQVGQDSEQRPEELFDLGHAACRGKERLHKAGVGIEQRTEMVEEALGLRERPPMRENLRKRCRCQRLFAAYRHRRAAVVACVSLATSVSFRREPRDCCPYSTATRMPENTAQLPARIGRYGAGVIATKLSSR